MLDRLTQDTRLLRLTTPAGAAQLLAECVRGEEAIGRPFAFDISALSTDAAIPLKSLAGQPALLELLTADSTLRPFHGHILAAELSGSNGGLARYQLRLEPWTAFLGKGRDSRIFQDMSVCDILDALLASWRGQGKLAPAWRFELADRGIYPKRSLCTQYQESDWAFAERLMAEEGLFYFFEHLGDAASPSLGSHTLVIADHNAAFKPNAQALVNFTQPGAVMREDSMDRWRMETRQLTNAIALQSWDYRTLQKRAVNAAGADSAALPLTASDVPGAYAYTSREHGQRLAERRLQALDTRRNTATGAGTVRTIAPGTTFTLQGEATTSMLGDDACKLLTTRVQHLMHNNLSAQTRSVLQQKLGPSPLEASRHATGEPLAERPLYRNRVEAIRASLPYRSTADWRRPTVQGQQTAIVVGPSGAPVHTDRDHRIKVQFHWQRGDGSHSRLSPSMSASETGAPADDRAGTWVRVATPLAPIAGANWGSNALPRVGQEVLVDFLEGDIDRPVVIGTLYNGQGQPDAQDNQVAQGNGAAIGNAPAWFPGETEAYAHAAVLSGLKSQSLQSSQTGSGAYSQLVFDDTPGQSRLSLQCHAQPHQGSAELNLGFLRQQTDNQRLLAVGFGAELKTEHALALRAGQGMLLSSRTSQGASGQVLDSREAQGQVEAGAERLQALAELAKTHQAGLPKEPDPEKLPAVEGLRKSAEALANRTSAGVTAFGMPLMQWDSPAGIVAATPASAVLTTGITASMSAGQDINFASQANLLHSAAGGISLFTRGKAEDSQKLNQETGLHLHAASGKFSTQSQDGPTTVSASRTVTAASTDAAVSIAAKQHVRLTAQGAALRLEGGNIELRAPGKVEFKASMKDLTGPQNASASLPALPKLAVPNLPARYSNRLDVSNLFVQHDFGAVSFAAKRADGKAVTGLLDQHGRTAQVFAPAEENIDVLAGTSLHQWNLIYDYDNEQDA